MTSSNTPGVGGDFTQYRRKQIAELRPWKVGDDLSGVSISDVDAATGSPEPGDMIARNPKNHKDQWLVAAAYFADNFEPASLLRAEGSEESALVKELRDQAAAETKAADNPFEARKLRVEWRAAAEIEWLGNRPENPCSKIFEHKWLDPQCVETGCRSLSRPASGDAGKMREAAQNVISSCDAYGPVSGAPIEALREALALPASDVQSQDVAGMREEDIARALAIALQGDDVETRNHLSLAKRFMAALPLSSVQASVGQVDKTPNATIEELVNRFLAWRLPESVCSDTCASQRGYPHRTGTNLLDANEARQMIEYLFASPGYSKDWCMAAAENEAANGDADNSVDSLNAPESAGDVVERVARALCEDRWLNNPPHKWSEVSEYMQEGFRSVARKAIARTASIPAPVDREAVARIIDPQAYNPMRGFGDYDYDARDEAYEKGEALKKADAILALLPVGRGEEVEKKDNGTTNVNAAR